ncbi:conserved hypothetical protein [Zunongwangia profunda SM-A87]|uniref:Uncharacterized protein n=2 Tax=Flavobacteriales TaxID=200644 RepID=D5BJJ9_ZUNPS|nr:conserved hypothetical protein [Zunongwangia profunda SM-A87]
MKVYDMKHQIKVNKIWFFLSFVILLTSAYCQTSNSIPKILAEKLNEGHLYIPDSLSPGHYFLVAQTPNSINKDEEVIKSVRKVKIIQNISSLQKEITTDPPQLKQKELDFSLMPEGGHLVSGLKNKLAFKAVDKYRNPQEVSGTLFENNKTLIEFKSLHAGMGSFYFIPDSKKEYHIELEGSSKKYILQEIKSKGQVLQLLSNS